MLPDVGGAEFLLIAAIALIVVGPKDLPVLMRKIGKGMAKMRGMAQEFRASFDEMARQSELDELRKEVEAMRADRLNPLRAAETAFTAGFSDEEFASLSVPAAFAPAPEPPTEKTARKARPAAKTAVAKSSAKAKVKPKSAGPAAKPNPAARKAAAAHARSVRKKTPA